MMEYDDFMELVADMRRFQKKYFKTRDRVALARSKELEKEVDKQIEYWEKDKQPILF